MSESITDLALSDTIWRLDTGVLTFLDSSYQKHQKEFQLLLMVHEFPSALIET